MAKPDVVARKRELVQQAAQERQNRLGTQDYERNARGAALAPTLLLLASGAYFNRSWLGRFMPGAVGQRLGAKLTWYNVERRIPLPAGGTEFAVADELEALVDSGRFGTAIMGALEIFRFQTPDDLALLNHFDKVALGLAEPQGGIRASAEPGLPRRFRDARRDLMLKDFTGMDRCLDADLPVWAQEIAWAAVDGLVEAGPVDSLEGATPFEVGYSHKNNTIVWCRSLARQPAEVEPPELELAEGATEGIGPYRLASAAPGEGMGEIEFDEGGEG